MVPNTYIEWIIMSKKWSIVSYRLRIETYIKLTLLLFSKAGSIVKNSVKVFYCKENISIVSYYENSKGANPWNGGGGLHFQKWDFNSKILSLISEGSLPIWKA